MKGIRLVGFMLVMLLALGSGIALAEQENGGSLPEAEPLPERTASSETVSLPDGQLETRIYPEPVNYRDEDGNWQPIGERLREADEQTLTNGPNDFDVDLPKQIDSKAVRFEVDGQWVESQLLRKDVEDVELEGAIATYEGEGNAPSFEFTGLSNGLKEEIELSNPGQANSFAYELSASDGLVPSLAEDGSVRFVDSEGTAVVILPAPVMSDSASVESRDVHYELGPEEDGHWKLTVVADREWLEQPDRKFPVWIDPTMTTGPALDCVIGGKKGETGWIDCAAWGRKDLLIGYTPKLEASKDNWWRSLLEFDMTGVPVNSEVTSATFNIRSLEVAQNTKGVELRKTTSPWTWQASWSRYDGPEHLWTTEGGDYSESLGEVLTATRGTQIGWWQFNMPTGLVEKEVNAEEWMGTILKLLDDKVRECGKESCTQRQVKFDSSAATTVANRPYLSVVYKAPAPIATTEAPTSLTETGATLKGQVNPHGYATTYQFEYGLTTSYGTKVPISAESVGSGKTNVSVSKSISGLKNNTTYNYRVSATNAYGTTVGVNKTFTTPKLPTATTEAATAISEAGATLKGSVTTYEKYGYFSFEYGLTTAYGSEAPASPQLILGGGTATAVSETVKGLAPGTTYHYRVRGSNIAGAAYGVDKTFTTTNPPQTTITSPMPTYLSTESPSPVKFEASQSGSTFKCGFDEGEKPTKTCTSPYTLPGHPTSGWHTFAVVATNVKGEVDQTPAKYVFNPGIYPPAPTTSKLAAPTEGEQSASHVTLQAEWGQAPAGGGVTGVTFQYTNPAYSSPFKNVPSKCVVDKEEKEVTWPLPVSENPGRSDPVFFDLWHCKIVYGGTFKFRAVFDGGTKAAGASEAVAVEMLEPPYDQGAATDATQQVGPVNLDLLTGQFTITRTDVSIPVPGYDANLEFTRTYGTNFIHTALSPPTIGGGWRPSGAAEQEFEGEAWAELREHHEPGLPPEYDQECEEEGWSHEECLAQEALPASEWIEVVDNEGGVAAFEVQGSNYIAPEYMKEFVLTKHESGGSVSYELASPEGTHTLFTSFSDGIYRPASVSWQATAKSVRMVYAFNEGGGHYRLRKMIGPAPPGVTCSDATAIETPGCRTLTLQYTPCECTEAEELSSITYYNASGQPSQSKVVAQYEYDSFDRLSAVWDPRISPALKETYTYGQNLLSLTPPGLKPWTFEYANGYLGRGDRLAAVKRASLLESPATAQWTIDYEVPIKGAGAPYDMSAASVAKWGQSDFPVNATAVFPPSEVPSDPPSSYSEATITYTDPDGYAVNTASPQVTGASGPSIATSETDRHGNVIRSLSAQNRLLALAAGAESVAMSRKLDEQSTYSADGTRMLESLGPLHKIRLEAGGTAEARAHTVIQYDENAPAPPSGSAPFNLPTTETTSARLPSGEDIESKITETEYHWGLRKPEYTIVDPFGLYLRTEFRYDETGQLAERVLPGGYAYEETQAHSTLTYYYKATASGPAQCASNPKLAGLPCMTMPGKQPGTAGQPEVQVTRYASYNGLDQPTEIIESPGGKEEAAKTRKTIATYDAAGRLTTRKQVGGGVEVPPTQTVYNPNTGAPVEQKLACESECYSSFFGSLGAGIGQLDNPGGIAIDGEGNLLVADRFNRRVQKFDAKGEYMSAFGSKGTANGQFEGPADVAIDAQGSIWVTDMGNSRIQKFNAKGEFIAKFGSEGSGKLQFQEPEGIAISSKGNIFIADTENDRVQVLNEKGEFVRFIGSHGSGEGQFLQPTGIAVSAAGNVFVGDWGNNRVEVFSETGTLIRQFGSYGTGNGQLKHPAAVDIDSSGNVYVGDTENTRIQKFNEKGEYLSKFGSGGSGQGQFSLGYAMGIAASGKGDIWISDNANNRVQRWNTATSFDNQAIVVAYDELGRPEQYTDADGSTSKTTYDLLGRPATIFDGKGTQTYGYDETSGLLVALGDSAAGTFTASYDADGKMIEEGLPNGLVAKTTYDETGEPTKLSYTKTVSCAEKCTWIEESNERSIRGQVLLQKSLSSSQQYSYDNAGRLTLAQDTTGGSCTTRQYSFDADSNRTKLTTRTPGVGGACDTKSSGASQEYKYDAADRLIGPEPIAYDSFGRITMLSGKFAGGSTLTTSFFSNEMISSQSQAGLTNIYQLDATRRPRQVTQTGTKTGTEVFHYSMASDSAAWTERGGTWTRSISGIGAGLAAIQESSGTTSLQLTNLHGDVVATASLSLSAKEPTANFEFDEFGNPKKGSAGRYGWLGGKQRRTELPSGVIQMGVRSYVPTLGRFISLDPIEGGSANAYEYANADPLNQFDLMGTVAHLGHCKTHVDHPHPSTHRGRKSINVVLRASCIGSHPGFVRGRVRMSIYDDDNRLVARGKWRTINVPVQPGPVYPKEAKVGFGAGAPKCVPGDYRGVAEIVLFPAPPYDPKPLKGTSVGHIGRIARC